MNRIKYKTIFTVFTVMLAILMICTAMPVLAKVSVEEAAKLKTELTPVGAIRAGNKEGTIPAWTGGLSKIPANVKYEAKSGLPHPDPFADDKPLFTITAQNVDQYKDKLTSGLLQMFKQYPDTWKMHIYPTRRSAAFSEADYEGTYSNALTAEVIDDYGSTTNFGRGYPFPIPKSGIEAMLNFVLIPHGAKNITTTYGGAIVQANGKYPMNTATNNLYFQVDGVPKEKFDPKEFVIGKMVTMNMPGREGEIALLMEPADYSKNDSLGYNYAPGTRRVRRNPNMWYDGMDSTSGGIGCSDDSFMWKGKFDRFTWTLTGKKEMYIPYNTYAGDLLPSYVPILTPHHPNPEYLRWELHRVWEVAQTLKEGARHVYGKGFYYLDEDTWLIALKDRYDKRETLWRMALSTTKQYYDFPVARQVQYYLFDFQVDFYAAFKFINGMPPESYEELPDDYFTVQNLRDLGTK